MSFRKRRASTAIIALLSLQIVLAGLNILFVFHQSRLLSDDARIINLSGVVRGSMQRAVKLALLGADPAEAVARADTLLSDFRQAHPGYAMREAGQEYLGRLELLERGWAELKADLGRWGRDPRPGDRQRVLDLSESLWNLANEVVSLAQDASQRKLTRLRYAYVFAGLELLGMLAVVWLVVTMVRSRLEPQATRDPLTGLSNRRVYDEILPHLVASAHRYETSLSLICFDLDHFKGVNDSLGHAAGDEVLRRVARTVHEQLRSSDVLCRVGGEEFSLVCPHTDADQAARLAEKTGQAVRRTPMGPAGNLTISLGVATLRPHEGHETLQARADVLLYAAKRAGRDRLASDRA